jgi:hypothetical protein
LRRSLCEAGSDALFQRALRWKEELSKQFSILTRRMKIFQTNFVLSEQQVCAEGNYLPTDNLGFDSLRRVFGELV